jgi:hypothetical protein
VPTATAAFQALRLLELPQHDECFHASGFSPVARRAPCPTFLFLAVSTRLESSQHVSDKASRAAMAKRNDAQKRRVKTLAERRLSGRFL